MTEERKTELESFWDSAFKTVDVVLANKGIFGDSKLDDLPPDVKLKLAATGIDGEFEAAFSAMSNNGKVPDKPEPPVSN